MLKTPRARGLKICVGHQYRDFRLSRMMKQLNDDGAVVTIMRVL